MDERREEESTAFAVQLSNAWVAIAGRRGRNCHPGAGHLGCGQSDPDHRNSRQSRGRKVSRHQVPDNIARAYKVARVVEDQRLQNLSANMSTEEYLRMLLRNEGQQGGIRGGQRLLEMTPE